MRRRDDRRGDIKKKSWDNGKVHGCILSFFILQKKQFIQNHLECTVSLWSDSKLWLSEVGVRAASVRPRTDSSEVFDLLLRSIIHGRLKNIFSTSLLVFLSFFLLLSPPSLLTSRVFVSTSVWTFRPLSFAAAHARHRIHFPTASEEKVTQLSVTEKKVMTGN